MYIWIIKKCPFQVLVKTRVANFMHIRISKVLHPSDSGLASRTLHFNRPPGVLDTCGLEKNCCRYILYNSSSQLEVNFHPPPPPQPTVSGGISDCHNLGRGEGYYWHLVGRAQTCC